MDPVTAIGVASGILTFVTFSGSLIKGWKQIHESGSLEENSSLGDIIRRMETLHSRLIPPDHDTKSLSNDAKNLCELAKDCQKISHRLLELLGKMKSSESKHGLRAKWQTLSATWNSVIHDKDKQQLEEELARCHQRLTAVLAFLTRTKLEQLKRLVRDNGERFTRLQTNVRELNIELRKRAMDEETRDRIERLVSVQEQTIKQIGHERVLKSLRYSDMQKRSDNIRQRLEEINEEQDETGVTFQWILDQGEETANTLDDDDEMDSNDEKAEESEKWIRDRARERFTKWLSTDGENVFHILGRFGSGKSTLMQFLSDSPRTEEILQVWAGDRRLVRANFFFSTLIGGLQQVLAGLRRTLLYEILKQCPEMTPEVLSKAWEEAISLPWQLGTTVEIRSKDISAALRQVIRRSHSSKTCFCFFIDGLDEFYDEDGLDKQDLVDLLNKWITDSKGNLKLCVASREEPEFKFSPETTLRLHDLTHYDMRRFVQQRLHGKVSSHMENRLAKIIPEKAQGVFLWVALVTRGVREETKIGGSPEDILNQFPPGLRPLLDRTIESIPEQHRLKAYLSFDMLLLLQNSLAMRSLPILAYSFLEDYCKNPEFSKPDTGSWEQDDDGAVEKRIGSARTQLYGWCKGLLEPQSDEYGKEYITFTHRSIREYLETTVTKQQRSHSLRHHAAGNALIQLLIAEVRSRISRNRWGYSYNKALTSLGLEQLFDSRPFEFLEALHFVIEKAASKYVPERRSIHYKPSLWTPLDYMFEENDYSYPTWRLEYDPTATETISEFEMLLFRYFRNSRFRLLGVSDSAFLDLLLKKGRSHLQTKIPLFLDFTTHYKVGRTEDIYLSIWQHYLLAETDSRVAEPAGSVEYIDRSKLDQNFALISESFLKAGADSHISVNIAKCEESGGKTSEGVNGEINFEIGRDKTTVTVQFRSPRGWGRICKNWSLEDIIKSLKTPNKDVILELIDRNTRMLEDAEGLSDSEKELQTSKHIVETIDKSNAGKVQPRWIPSISISPEHVFGFALGLLSALVVSLLIKILA